MNDVSGRISKRMTELKVTQADIKRATGAGKATISSWVKGDTKPSGIYATKLASCLKCNTDWLLTGVGQMEVVDPSKKMKSAIPEGTEILIDVSTAKGYLPVIDWNMAINWADGEVLAKDVKEWAIRPSHLSDKSFVLRIIGSNNLPEFKPDEMIYVEPEIELHELKDGNLVIACKHGDDFPIFRKLVIGDNASEMYLKPLNENWVDQTVISMDNCKLIGIVDSKLVKYR